MKIKKLLFSIVVLLCFSAVQNVRAQKVGLVLSGGGATAMAHLGIMIALEENGIPIDYITGTSMGGWIGGYYAAGYSPKEIKQILISQEFINMTKGILEEEFQFYFKQKTLNASWISLKFAKDTLFQSTLPTSAISPVPIDYSMMHRLSGASAKANYDFDKLFVPFRCVASDITSKTQVIFRDGNMSEAIRASMSYPFYLKPISVDGVLLFDGGIYNNFPADIMYDEFLPDVIIGCNVSSNEPPPTEDDLLSQLRNMLMAQTDYTINCEQQILLTPPITQGTFEFSEAEVIITLGYEYAMANMEIIKNLVKRRVAPQDINLIRETFRSGCPPLLIDSIAISGLNKGQSKYVSKLLRASRKEEYTIEAIKSNYFRVFADDQIKSIFPTTRFNPLTKKYLLNLKVKKEHDIVLDLGGNFSSKPINQAYIGMTYQALGRTALSINANSYFGKLYGSSQVGLRWDLPVRLPFYIESNFTLNRWDYYKSSATFFEDIRPSFFVQNEKYLSSGIGFPVGNKGRVNTGITTALLTDNYYQTVQFTSADHEDVTYFEGNSIYARFERGTLNKKQYPSSGAYFEIKARGTEGDEYHIPGSTSNESLHYRKYHQWMNVKLSYNAYYKGKGKIRLGLLAEANYSNQPLFKNYSSSVLRAPAFKPTPESSTLFLESFRAFQYAGLGHQVVVTLKNNLELRLEGYIFQPYQELLQNDDLSIGLGREWDKRYTIATAAAVFHSPIGPVCFSTNYYHNNPEVSQGLNAPISFLFHFGYMIYNRKALD